MIPAGSSAPVVLEPSTPTGAESVRNGTIQDGLKIGLISAIRELYSMKSRKNFFVVAKKSTILNLTSSWPWRWALYLKRKCLERKKKKAFVVRRRPGCVLFP